MHQCCSQERGHQDPPGACNLATALAARLSFCQPILPWISFKWGQLATRLLLLLRSKRPRSREASSLPRRHMHQRPRPSSRRQPPPASLLPQPPRMAARLPQLFWTASRCLLFLVTITCACVSWRSEMCPDLLMITESSTIQQSQCYRSVPSSFSCATMVCSTLESFFCHYILQLSLA